MENHLMNQLKCYACYHSDPSVRTNSSSGGIFTLFAEKILSCYGTVYGVAMSEDCYSAEFIRITNRNDIRKLQGSKYLQAKVGKIYLQVKSDLEACKMVLFSGTGCQINALKKFLGKDYDNLLCLDVICHGVPSPKLWRKYAEFYEKQNGSKIVDVNFRCKDKGWFDFGIKLIDDKNSNVFVSKENDSYLLMFLRDYCLRPSCYECTAKNQKESDISIADFWGIDSVIPKMKRINGVSFVILRTDKGSDLFSSVSKGLISERVSFQDGVKRNPAEYRSAKRPLERDVFFVDMNSMTFEELRQKYAVPKPISLKRKIKNLLKKIPLIGEKL